MTNARAQAQNQAAIQHFAAERTDEAIACLQQACALAPDWLEPAGNLAWVWHHQGRYSKAEPLYRGILARGPCAEADYFLAAGLFEMGELEEAETHLLCALSGEPERLPAWLLLAEVRLERLHTAAAQEALERAAALLPGESPDASGWERLRRRCELQQAAGGWRGAWKRRQLRRQWARIPASDHVHHIGLVEQLTAHPHARPDELFQLACALRDTRGGPFEIDNPEERSVWRRAAQAAPDRAEVWVGYLHALLAARRGEPALRAARMARARIGAHREICMLEARAAEILCDWDGALAASRNAVEMDPQALGAKVNLALYLDAAGQGRSREAGALWNEIAGVASAHPIAEMVRLVLEDRGGFDVPSIRPVHARWVQWVRERWDNFFPEADSAPQGTHPCPVCGGERLLPVYHRNPRRWPIVRCAACGLVQVNPQPEPSSLVEMYGPDYMGPYMRRVKQLSQGSDRPHFTKVFQWLTDLPAYEQSLGPQRRMLDVGCACGLLMRDFALRGWQVEGIDVSETAVAFCRELGFTAECGTLQAYAPPPGRYHLVGLFHVIEHVLDPRALLLDIHRCLAPDGRLILLTPDWLSLPGVLTGPEWFCNWEHVFYFSLDGMIALLEETGFELLNHRTHVGIDSETPRLGWDRESLSDLFKLPVERAGLGDVMEIYARARK